MTPGILNNALETLTLTTALGAGTAIALFTEDTQRTLCMRMNRKAAQAAGIEAMAVLAIQTGDEAPLDAIAAMASELAEELNALACLAGQIRAQQNTI